jgi:hypothetical protein
MDCPTSCLSCTIGIEGLPHLDETQGIVFCAVLESTSEGPYNHIKRPWLEFKMNWHENYRLRSVSCLKSKNVWYEYSVQGSFKLNSGRSNAEFFIESKWFLFVGSVGVHIIHKHAENAKDHPNVTHVEFHFPMKEFISWEVHPHTTNPIVGLIKEDEVDEEGENLVCSIKEVVVDEESENSVDSIKEDECKTIERISDGI